MLFCVFTFELNRDYTKDVVFLNIAFLLTWLCDQRYPFFLDNIVKI